MEAAQESQSTASFLSSGGVRAAFSVALALAAGLGLRLWMLKQFFQVNGDALIYGAVAKNLLLHGRYALNGAGNELYPTLIRLPGYPLFLAFCFRVFGMENYISAAWVQIALELAGCLLLADFASRIASARFSRGAGHCTLWLAALCPFTAIYAAAPLSESLTLFVLALALWSAERFRARPGWPLALLFTLAVTYAALLRPDGALVAVALAPALVFGLRRKDEEDASEKKLAVLKGHDFSRVAGAQETDSANQAAEKRSFVSEHDFSRAESAAKSTGPLQAAEKLVNGASSGCFVSGHDFSRAANAIKSTWALAHEGSLPDSLPLKIPRLVRMAVVCVLLALAPFAVWSGRNWQVFHVFQPLAPRLATDPGEDLHLGWERWVKSWCLDFVSTYQIYWNIPGDVLDIGKLPSRAFDSPAQYAETAAVAADYNLNQEITPALDARFGKLADERRAAHPLRTVLWLPLGRMADMWLRPRVENLPIDLDWWVYAHHNAETRFSWAYAGLNALYLLLAIAGVCLRPRFWRPMLAYLVLRSVLLTTIEAPEARYTLECFPMLFALGGVAAYRFTYVVFLSVLRMKASAGRC